MQRAVQTTIQLLAALLLAAPALARTSVSLDESSTYPAARIGLNQGSQDYYETYLLKNLTGINPGFEGQIKDVVQNVQGVGTRDAFSSNNEWDSAPADFFAGGTFFVAHGANRGCTGKIASNTPPLQAKQGPSRGPTFTLGTLCPHVFQRGDVVFTRREIFPTDPHNFNFDAFGWRPENSNGGVAAIDSQAADQSPESAGKQCVRLSAVGANSTASVDTSFDTDGSHLNYSFSGPYTQSIKARLVSGSGTLTLSGVRLNPGHSGISWSQTFTPSGQWSTYSAHFTGLETRRTAPGPVQISIAFTGQGTVLIDDSSLTSDGDTNPTVFRDQVIQDEKLWNPGESRYWAGQNAESLSNWITPQFGREGTVNGGHAGIYDQSAQIQYGLHDWLVKEAYEGVPQVWIEMPITWKYNSDAADMVDYLAGGANTVYGTRRIKLGQTAPWTSVFRRIVLEYGNEVWNPSAAGENMPMYSIGPNAYWSYVPMVIQFCAAMKADSNWKSSVMKCAAGLQGGTFWPEQLVAQDRGHAVDLQANNEYGQYKVTDTTGNDQWISAWTEAWAAAYDQANPFHQTFNSAGIHSGVYEYNNSTVYPSVITQAAAAGYPEGEGYGLVDILMPLFNEKVLGITDNNFFTFSQRNQEIRNAAGQKVNLKEWGAVVGLGGSSANVRPMFYAVGMVNNCIGNGVGYATKVTGGPTYDFSGYNGVGPEKDVPYLNFFAFKSASSRCIVVVNTDPEHSHVFTFTGDNPPSGTVTAHLYYSSNLTDSNEQSGNVRLASATSQNPSSFEIQPHSAMTIGYTVAPEVSAPPRRSHAVLASASEASGLAKKRSAKVWTAKVRSARKAVGGAAASARVAAGLGIRFSADGF